MAAPNVDHEINLLIKEIMKHGKKLADGRYSVKYGVVFKETQQIFEALANVLRSAKKRSVIDFPGQLLLSPTHDNVEITLSASAAASVGDGKSEHASAGAAAPAAAAAAAPAAAAPAAAAAAAAAPAASKTAAAKR